ncbi:MAG: TIGR02996 domain-containing protein [Myxococcota bacterium]|nr:TIGR02996 domain-containing protein [Myxococcota bacterium]
MIGPRNPTLEAAIRADRSDPGPYLVYADWLQAQGSALGELIVVQHALATGADPAKQQRAAELIRALELPEPDLATVGWRRGLWEWLRLENARDWMDGSFDALALARRLFESPACAVLAELRLGMLRWGASAVDVPAVLAEAARHDWAAHLTRLHLGDVPAGIDMAYHVVGDVGAVISRSFPGLRWLRIHSGASCGVETFGVAGLALPALVELVVETCSMASERARDLAAASLPALERLELWFRSPFEEDAAVEDLGPILAGTAFPQLRHLALPNSTPADALAGAVAGSPIAARLASFDLSMGTLSDEGAATLAGAAAAFPGLRTLSVDDNFLSAEAIATLRARFTNAEVVSRGQKVARGGARYVTIAE